MVYEEDIKKLESDLEAALRALPEDHIARVFACDCVDEVFRRLTKDQKSMAVWVAQCICIARRMAQGEKIAASEIEAAVKAQNFSCAFRLLCGRGNDGTSSALVATGCATLATLHENPILAAVEAAKNERNAAAGRAAADSWWQARDSGDWKRFDQQGLLAVYYVVRRQIDRLRALSRQLK